MKKILVCGGRDYGTWVTEEGYKATNHYEVEKLNNTLDALKQEFDSITIIQGDARGADSLAKSWAIRNKVSMLNFPADWARYGKSAGYLRNVQMLEEGKPDLVIAFPGGSGTAMMCKIAAGAGVEVRQIS
jgi:2-phospho-L-lactate guanylyltransferase (CobY/MobA/RfbA family)